MSEPYLTITDELSPVFHSLGMPLSLNIASEKSQFFTIFGRYFVTVLNSGTVAYGSSKPKSWSKLS